MDPIERVLASVFEQVVSVCLGIDHMMKRYRMGQVGSRAASYGTVHTHAVTTTAARTATATAYTTAPAAPTATAAAAMGTVSMCERGHLASCRLCESTRRVLIMARAHVKRRHRDGSDCGACGVWAKVMDRCASLGIVAANGASAWPGDNSNGLLTIGGNGGGDVGRK